MEWRNKTQREQFNYKFNTKNYYMVHVLHVSIFGRSLCDGEI